MATGFRAPNIDDLAKVFESAGGEQVVVPNPGLRPEQTINLDISAERQFGGLLKVELTGFYTWFRNAIVLDAFTLNEASAIVYDGVLTPVVANQNKARAFVYGIQAAMELAPFNGCLLYSYLTYTKGRYQDNQGEVPMDHIPPLFGKTGISYKWRFFTGEFYSLYHGRKPKRLYNPYGEDNLQYATPDGMPGWYTLNVSTSWELNNKIRLQVAAENILDKNYRVFASGISAAGRNWVLKCSLSF